jgi:hypothetical protein
VRFNKKVMIIGDEVEEGERGQGSKEDGSEEEVG